VDVYVGLSATAGSADRCYFGIAEED